MTVTFRILSCLTICFAAVMLDAQTLWTYYPTNAFPGLIFSNPICITSPPGESNRLFVLEKHGRIIVITNLMNPTRTIFMNISSRVGVDNSSESADVTGEEGLLGMAFHPGYATNGYFYVFYTGLATNGTSGLHDILSRFQISSTNANQGNSNSETHLIVQYDRADNHNSGDIHFGPDGYLYLSLGDEGNEYNSLTNAQHINLNLFSGIIRIDVDKKTGSLKPNPDSESAATTNYMVPPDNPFIGATNFDNLTVNPSQVRTEFWAVGLRNPWRFSFDPATGILYCGEVGQDQYEEIDVIKKGGNYGWATFEGSNSPPSGVSTNGQPIPQNPIFPIVTYAHGSLGGPGDCVIGGVVYHGNRLPQLRNSYIYGDYVSGAIWSIWYFGVSASKPQLLFNDPGMSCFGIDPSNGDVLYAKLNGGNNSIIERIVSPTTMPAFTASKFSGRYFIASGTNGPPNGNYSILTSTNRDTPIANWTRISTNPFDAQGNFIFTNPWVTNSPIYLYMLQLR
ncbi:MAG TPA: PQQ-dependent sugar dehydrogenase [Candidatus Acidoferrales bacterium]|nr:PQQ-dependent sugar dehydrogenase [Candidatus Acidoferrales bacterium]